MKEVYEMEEMKRLSEEELDSIQGGLIFDATGTPECDPFRPWEVIHNNTGEVLGRYATRDEACYAAKQYHSGSTYDTQICSREVVEYLRAHPQIQGR